MRKQRGRDGAVKPRRRTTRTWRDDSGFGLMETVVSIALLGIVMTAATTFFVNVLSSSSYLRAKQVATQVADDTMEQARAFELKALLSSRDKTSSDAQWAAGLQNPAIKAYLDNTQEVFDALAATATGLTCSVIATLNLPACIPTQPVQQTLSSGVYSTSTFLGSCVRLSGAGDCVKSALTSLLSTDVGYYRIVVAVTWKAKQCPANLCTYVTSELQNATPDPVFNLNTGTILNINQTNAALSVTSPGNQASTKSVPISLQMLYAGGTGQVKWTATLPTGLQIDPLTGAIFGTPSCPTTAACTYNAKVTGDDTVDPVSSVTFTWTVSPVPDIATPMPGQDIALNNGIAMTALVPTLTTGTGSTPFTWSGSGLPTGLSLNSSTGAISGTPTVNGTFTVTETVLDHSNKTDSVTYTFTVTPNVVPPAAQKIRAGTAVNLTIVSHGLTSPVWTVDALPAGLSLDASTGIVSGTPTTIQTVPSTVKVSDSKGYALTTTIAWTIVGRISAVGDVAGQCFDVNNNSSADGATMLAYTCGTQANQTFSLAADNTLHVTTGSADRCLTAASATAGAIIVSRPCSYPALQTWAFRPVTGGQQLVLSGTNLAIDVVGTTVKVGLGLDLVVYSDTTRANRTVWGMGA